MRAPTNRFAAWDWWREAVAGVAQATPTLDAPQCGLFRGSQSFLDATGKRRKHYVAASIDLVQDVDPDTGELIGDETFVCIVAGRACDAHEQWIYLSGSPVSETEHARLLATAGAVSRIRDLSESIVT
jgi:hypothetical protein